MSDPWTFSGESVSLRDTAGIVTLVEGSSFCLSGRSGDIRPDAPHGLFVLDVRALSKLALRLSGRALEPLTVSTPVPFAGTFVTRASPRPGLADSSLLVLRERTVERGMRERIEVRNYGREPVRLALRLDVGVDFADVFAVKEGRASRSRGSLVAAGNGLLRFECGELAAPRTVDLVLSGDPRIDGPRVEWHVDLAPGESWSNTLEVVVAIAGGVVTPRGGGAARGPADVLSRERFLLWREQGLTIGTPCQPLRVAVTRAVEDLGALRIFDPDHPERAVVAAGAPWFMTLFGRDSLLASYMALIVGPELARGVLETLADHQGSRVDVETEEEPGRILHEVRFGDAPSVTWSGAHIYYGTVDATPLFVVLLGELRRWGLEDDVVARLLPHADRALDWVRDYGDRDGDGYVEYGRTTERGLVNQGWKDSWDGVTFADGRIAEPPIALCEVQGYVYAAYVARAHFADEYGDSAGANRWREQAAELKERFNRDFWLDDRGWFALALDRDKRPVDALASNMGHCLWTGIVDEDKAASVAAHLLSDEMFSGWGVRTLATSMAAYNPISYHNGSVWPHDNAIVVAGLVRYGYVEEAHRVLLGLLDAASAYDGRLPELFAGLSRSDVPTPVAYPTSCSPQAWASASPLLLLRSLLRLDPWVPHGKVWLAPALPDQVESLTVDRLNVGPARLGVAVARGDVRISGPLPGIELVTTPRDPLTNDLRS